MKRNRFLENPLSDNIQRGLTQRKSCRIYGTRRGTKQIPIEIYNISIFLEGRCKITRKPMRNLNVGFAFFCFCFPLLYLSIYNRGNFNQENVFRSGRFRFDTDYMNDPNSYHKLTLIKWMAFNAKRLCLPYSIFHIPQRGRRFQERLFISSFESTDFQASS